MAYTKEQLEAAVTSLNDAIVSGVRSATVGGQTVTYNTIAELRKARDDFQNQLNALTGRGRRSKQTYGYYGGRGYDC